MGINRKFPVSGPDGSEWSNGGRAIQIGGALSSTSLAEPTPPADFSPPVELPPDEGITETVASSVKAAAPKKRAAKKAAK